MTVSISAHSGGSGDSSAVTYEQFERSLKSGAEYVELDVRRTADGIFVAQHDARLAGAAVADRSYAELQAAAGYPIPQVETVLRTLAGQVTGHLDLKDIGCEYELVAMALEILGPGNFVVTSLEDVSIARIKSRYPDVRAALSLGRDVSELPGPGKMATRWSELRPLRRLKSCGADWAAINHKLARLGVLGQCARQGIKTMVWTVNSKELIDHFLADTRVDVLITDRPECAVARRARLTRIHRIP